MKQKPLIIIMVGVLLVLGGLTFWDDWQTEKTTKEKKESTQLLKKDLAAVSEFQFLSKSSEEGEKALEITLKKKDDIWYISSPVKENADSIQVENFLKIFHDYNFAKVISKDMKNPEKFGLSKPNRKLTLKYSDGESIELSVGSKAPVGYNVYSQSSLKDDVYIGSQHLLVSSSKTLYDFREKKIVSFERKDISEWSFYRNLKPGNLKLDFKRSDGKFMVLDSATMKEAILASDAVVKDFLDDINALNAAAFVDTPSQKISEAFGVPDIVVSWLTKEGKKGKILFVKVGVKYLAAIDAENQIYELQTSVGTKIEKDLMGFRDRRVLNFKSENLSSVKIDGDTFSNVAGSWYEASVAGGFDSKGKYTGEGETPKEEEHVRAFVVDLEFAKTFAYIQLHDPLLSSLPKTPSHRVELNFKIEKPPVVIDFYPVKDEKDYRFVKYTDSKFLYKIDLKVLESMTSSSHEASSIEGGDVAAGHNHGEKG